MPLVLVSGFPSAGKSTRAEQLQTYLLARIASAAISSTQRLKVHLINDQTLGISRSAYNAAKTEKDARAEHYSAIKRVLSRDDIVISDALNYIKGFRYQLYCEAKALQTPSCVLHIGTPIARCRTNNAALLADPSSDAGYADADFENLVFRYEEPNGMARWDSPLFVVAEEDAEPPCEAIWEALVGSDGKGKVVRPNQATVLKPATPQNYLYHLDTLTSSILSTVLSHITSHPGELGGLVSIPGIEAKVELPAANVGLPQLQRIRRQFIAMNRVQSLEERRLGEAFVGYLNGELMR